jgi:O-antigen/teichoic acid export membrane protein
MGSVADAALPRADRRALRPVMADTLPWTSRARLQASLPALMTVGMQGLNSLSNLAITWFLVRRIGVSGFGYYSAYFIITINAVAVGGALVLNPLNSVASKCSSRRQAEFIQAARFSQMALVAALLAAGLIGALAAWAGGRATGPVIAVVGYVIGTSCGEFWRRIRFFRAQIREVFIFDLGRYILLVILLLGLPRVVPQPGPTAYTLAIAAPYLVAIAAGRLMGERSPPVPFERRRVLAQARRLFRSGKWLAGVALLKFADGGAVLFLSFLVLGPYQAGLLRLAQTIVGLTMPAMQALEHTVPRHLGQKIRESGHQHAMRGYRKLAILIVVAFAGMFAVLVALSPLAIGLMGVTTVGEPLRLVAGFSLVYLLTVVLTLIEFTLRARERAHIVTLSLTVSACATAALAYPNLLKFGAVGAVLTMVFTRSLSIAICSWAARRAGGPITS